tara:strand:+ start:219 stop:443 length:225 start_codon:yes stop_codon:yes gene_type:complete
MSDSVKKYHENERHVTTINKRSFVWVLDHTDGTVHLYNIRQDADGEACETLIELMGHKVSNCQWMMTERDKIYN